MLTAERNLQVGKTARQYWQLIRVLFFNYKVVGHVSAFFLCLGCASYLIGFIFPFFKMLSAPIAFLALFVFLFVGVILLPIGILSLLTNKHIYIMANISNKLFVVVLCFCIVCSLIAPLAVHSMKGESLSANIAFSIFLVGALYFWLAIYLMNKSFFLFGLVPLILGGCTALCSGYLIALHPLVLPFVSIITWALFYRWWSRFHPKRTGKKSIFIESDPKKLQELPIEKWLYFSSNHVRTPMGSLLLGYGDGRLSFVKKIVVIYTATFLFALFACGGFKGGHFTDGAFAAVLISLTYSFLLSGIDFLSYRMLSNFKRCWLLFSGNRAEFFLYIERSFLRGLRDLVVLNLSIICIFLWFGNHTNYFLYCLSGLVIFSLALAWNFYLNIYFYSRNGFVLGEVNYQKLIANVAIFLPPVVYLISKYQSFNIFEFHDVAAIGFVLLITALLKVMRSQSFNQWKKADF